MSRRNLVKAAVVAGVSAGASGSAMAEAKDEKPADTEALTVADIATVEKVMGRASSEDERKMMLPSMEDKRKNLLALRKSDLAASAEPAVYFEPRLPGAALPGGKEGLSLSRAPAPKWETRGDPDTLAFCTVAELARLVKARKITSAELTKMYLARLKKYGPRLLCVVSLTEDIALAQAARADAEIADGKYRGPLHGIPYGVKDLLAAKGTRTTYGVSPYKDQVIDEDSTVVARLEAVGAVLCAKFSMGELAMGDVWFGGKTRNPWKPDTGSSGSSAGSASATAAGLVAFAIGTETLGSITSPSRVCGTTGLRPTFGRVSRHGAMALSWTMDKIGPICRGVEDCAIVFSAIHGADSLDITAVEGIPFRWEPNRKLKDLRVGIDQKAWRDLAQDKNGAALTKACDAVLDVLRGLGVTLTPLELPAWDDVYDTLTGFIISVEGAASFERLRASGGLEQLVQQANWNWPNSFRTASLVPASDYLLAMRVRTHLQRAMIAALKDIDCYVTIPFQGPSLLYTNLCGQPTVITRAGRTESGLPISIEFTGNLYREDAALRLAFAYEQATEWHKQWPDVTKLPETPPVLAK